MSPELEVLWDGVNDGQGGDLLCTPPTEAHAPADASPVNVRTLTVGELLAIERAVRVWGVTTTVARRFDLPSRTSLRSALQRLARLRGAR